MSCKDCKERVFELIEREADDPEGVRAILADCPDCRAEFEQMKAALALAEQLPIEEPGAEIDAAILSEAELRIGTAAPASAPGAGRDAKVIPFRKRILKAPPWAMAAVALLAVGVGVWSIPRAVRLESDADRPMVEAKGSSQIAEAARDEHLAESAAPEEINVAAMDDISEAGPAVTLEAARGASRPSPRAKKQRAALAKRSAAEADAEDLAMPRSAAPVVDRAPAVAKEEGPAARSAEGGAAVAADAEAAFGALEPEDRDSKSEEASSCMAKVTAFERRLRDEKDYAPEPEEELAIGRCYRILGDTGQARSWLKRAAGHPETRRRAREALRSLPPK